jgi:hypothetical protein
MISEIARIAARRRLAVWTARAADSARPQRERLLRWVARARSTAFGRQHHFSRVRGVAEYQRAVPLRGYDGFEEYWRQAREGGKDVTWPGRIDHWAISSGTTSGEKYLPVSRDTIRTNRGGGFDSLVPVLVKRGARPFDGKLLFLGGSTALRRQGPSWIGDNTGIMARHVPALLRRFHAPGYEVAAEPRWDVKVQAAARATLREDVRVLAGVPSWLLLFADEVLREARAAGRPCRTLAELWPNLTAVVHGGVAFEPYRARFAEVAGTDLTYVDTYSASEGGMLAVQTEASGEGMLPVVDRGAFFEFIPSRELGGAEPSRLLLHEVETDVDYAVALTTNSGIWSYLVGDVVRFVSLAPPRLVFAGRTAHTLNAFGEHVSGGEIDRAVAAAARELDLVMGEHAVAVAFPDARSPRGRHVYYIELDGGALDARPGIEGKLAERIDARISEGNEDYTSHRAGGFGLDAPLVKPVPAGTFYRWMAARGKLGGQHKVPRVLTPALERELIEEAAR